MGHTHMDGRVSYLRFCQSYHMSQATSMAAHSGHRRQSALVNRYNGLNVEQRSQHLSHAANPPAHTGVAQVVQQDKDRNMAPPGLQASGDFF